MKRVFEVFEKQTEVAEDGKPYTYLAPHSHPLFADEEQEDGQREFPNSTQVLEAINDHNRDLKKNDPDRVSGEIVILEVYEI